MDHPVRVAPCMILFADSGGRFTDEGKPIFDDPESDGVSVRAKCSRAYDCGVCSLLHREIAQAESEGWVPGWECTGCIDSTRKDDEKNNQERILWGYYQAGRTPGTDPHHGQLGEYDNSDPDGPALGGCTRCGWQSSFLQLVTRRRRRR